MENTNKWETKQLVTMALMCALGVLLSFIELPLFPAAPFLKYDPSFVPALIVGLAYGGGAGVAVGVVGIVIHGIMLADLAGSIMNILVVIGFILPASLLYKKNPTLKSAAIGLVISTIIATILAILGNLVITPLYMGAPLESVIAMILPILLPFNLIKAVLNSLITLVVYRSIMKLIETKK